MTTLTVRTGDRVIYRSVVLGPTRLGVGRSPENAIYLSDEQVSKTHALLDVRDGRVVISDLGSKSGTLVNDLPIACPTLVRLADRVRIGPHLLTVELDEDGPPDTARFMTEALDEAPQTPRATSPVPPAEAAFLSALRKDPRDDATRAVYADWLEENGQKLKAEVLHLTTKLALLELSDPRREEIERRLHAIAPASDAPWRAVTTRPRIDRCDPTLEEACPKRWSELRPTDDDTLRHCHVCVRFVHFCGRLERVLTHGRSGHAIVLDPSLDREAALQLYDAAVGLSPPDGG